MAAVLGLMCVFIYRLLKSHLKQVRQMFEENIQARELTRQKLERNSEVIGENTAVMQAVNIALANLSRQLGSDALSRSNSKQKSI